MIDTLAKGAGFSTGGLCYKISRNVLITSKTKSHHTQCIKNHTTLQQDRTVAHIITSLQEQ